MLPALGHRGGIVKNWIFILALVFLAGPHNSWGDVVIDLRKTQAAPATRPDATTQPDTDNYTVSVLAVPDHDFATKFQTDGHAIEISGSVKAIENGKYRINIHFQERGGIGTLQSFSTTVEFKVGDSLPMAGTPDRTFVMTLAQGESKNEKMPSSRPD
jgi:hypothetical protein